MGALIWQKPFPPSMLGQPLSPADQTRLDKARVLLPTDCYSKAFDDCIFRKDTKTYPRCEELNALWTTNPEDPVYKELEKLTDQIPYCPAPSTTPATTQPNYLLIGGAALAAILAFFLFRR